MCVFSVFQLFNGFPQHATELLQTIDHLCLMMTANVSMLLFVWELRSTFNDLIELMNMNISPHHRRRKANPQSSDRIHQGNPSYRYYVISSMLFGEVGKQSQEIGVEWRTYGINDLCAEVFFCLA